MKIDISVNNRLIKIWIQKSFAHMWDINVIYIAFMCHYVTYSKRYPKGGRMGRSDTVSLWCVSLLINTRFHFFILE